MQGARPSEAGSNPQSGFVPDSSIWLISPSDLVNSYSKNLKGYLKAIAKLIFRKEW
jgi:hypothetical protein